MRGALRGIDDGICFDANFSSSEFLDKSGQRQLGRADELVVRHFTGQFAVGNDHKFRLEGRRNQSYNTCQFFELDDHWQPDD